MHTIMADIAEETIRKHRMLTKGITVLAAVSGGADSVCMLHFLVSVADKYGIRIVAVHVDHMLRGAESEDDRRFVEELCGRLGMQLFAEAHNVREAVAGCGGNIEETAREIRYSVFGRIASACGAARIAVAHNRNDRAETVLMNIIRGTGTDGLKGISYVNGKIIRPLLDVSRKEIEDYCRINSLGYRTDSTNLADIYTRNKVRLKLIPYIDSEFGADIVGSLCRLADIAASDGEYLEEKARRKLESIIITCDDAGTGSGTSAGSGTDKGSGTSTGIGTGIGTGTNKIVLDRAGFEGVREAVSSRIIRQCISKIKGGMKGIGISSKHMATVSAFISEGRTGARIQLPGGVRILRSYDRIIIYNDNYGSEGSITDFCVPLKVPGMTYVSDPGIFIKAEKVSIEEYKTVEAKKSRNAPSFGKSPSSGWDCRLPVTEFFDCSICGAGINIRNRMEGDMFRPIGKGGSCSLKKYMINRKMPAGLRGSIPLAACGREVLWVIGDRTGELYKVRDDACEVIKLMAGRTGQDD